MTLTDQSQRTPCAEDAPTEDGLVRETQKLIDFLEPKLPTQGALPSPDMIALTALIRNMQSAITAHQSLIAEALKPGDWKWCHSPDEEGTFSGMDFMSREAALADARTHFDGDEYFYVQEYRQRPIRIADAMDADLILEKALEGELGEALLDYAGNPEDGEINFPVTADQRRDLERRLKAACDAWQAVNAITPPAYCCETRNQERYGADPEEA